MRKSKTSRILISIVAYFLFLALGITFLVFYLNYRQSEGNKDYINREHALATKTFERKLETDYLIFKEMVDHSESVTLKDTLQRLKNEYPYLSTNKVLFFIEEETGLRESETVLINYSTLYFRDFEKYYSGEITIIRANDVLTNKYYEDESFIFFRYKGMVALLEVDDYIDVFINFFDNTRRGLIVSSDGFLYYYRNNNDIKNLSSVISDEDNIKILLTPGTSSVTIKNKDKDNYLIASTQLALDNNLFKNAYAIHYYFENDIEAKTQGIYDVALLFIVIALMIIIGAQLLIYRSLSIKNADIESSRLHYYYNKAAIIFLNKNGKIKGVNKTFKALVENWKDFKIFDDFLISDELLLTNNMQLLHKQNPFDCHIKTRTGEKTIRFIPVKKINGYDLIGEDITKRDSHFSEYKSLALYHQTTNLPNLSYFKINIKERISNKEYMKGKHAIILINISNFRNINRILGEETADHVLIRFAEFLKEQLEPSMDLYNTFMDYFLICFNTVKDFKDVQQWFNNLLVLLEKPVDVESSKINLKIKAGIYNFDGSKEKNLTDSNTVYQRALSALNQARNSDKNVVIYDESIGLNVEYQKQMESDLRTAIEKDEFVLYLQPQYDNNLGKIVAFEALIRWDNPKYINVSPQVYITLAETNNLIIEIGEIVIRKTFEMVKKLEKYNVKISMNVSPVQVLQAGFINDFLSLYNEYEIKKHSVAIEITETFLMSSFDLVVEKLKILRDNGIDIHLDDFGTGNSSLLYLQELPIDTIKIDRGFIMHLPQDRYSKAIINMIVALAKNLDLNVIAEGVETDSQNAYLNRVGCYVIQGWLISKARPLDEIIELLENRDKISVKEISSKKEKKKGSDA